MYEQNDVNLFSATNIDLDDVVVADEPLTREIIVDYYEPRKCNQKNKTDVVTQDNMRKTVNVLVNAFTTKYNRLPFETVYSVVKRETLLGRKIEKIISAINDKLYMI